VWLKETYVLSGACLYRVADLIAVMICRVTQSSANERNEEVARGLEQPDHPFLDEIVRIAAGEEVRARLEADEAVVAAHELVLRSLAAVPHLEHELEILELPLELLRALRCCGCPGSHGLSPGLRGGR
jgi:hypothetical protein